MLPKAARRVHVWTPSCTRFVQCRAPAARLSFRREKQSRAAGGALQVLADFSSQSWKSSWARYKKRPPPFEARQPVSKDADGAAQKSGLTWARGAEAVPPPLPRLKH